MWESIIMKKIRNSGLFMMMKKEWLERALSAAIIFVLAAIPILITRFPPSTDLPQHIAQVRLALESLRDPAGPYVIQWGAPNTLIYFFIYLFWKLFSLEILAKAILIFIVFLWVFSIFFLAGKRIRSLDMAILASLLIFNHVFYGGFLNFLIGFPVFTAWFLLTIRKEHKAAWQTYVFLILTSFLLYGSHALWFAAGAAWLFLISLINKMPLKFFFLRMATLIPGGILSLLWFRGFSSFQATSSFDKAPEWGTRPLEKFFSSWFLDASFGGIRGISETLFFFFLLVWGALSLWQHRKDLKSRVDFKLMAASGFFFVIAFFAPGKMMNTIFLSSRWFPICMMMLLLSLPAPNMNKAIRRIISFTVAAAFILVTTLTWVKYEKNELTGLSDSLAKIPYSSRILGLDFFKRSRFIKYRPFLQMSAYAQVFKGAELNFSFAEHSTGLVAYRTKRNVPWTHKLEWFAESVKKTDLQYFDYVLVNGNPYHHQYRIPRQDLSVVTDTGRWRLYKVNIKPKVDDSGNVNK